MDWTVLKLIEWTDAYLKKQGILKARLESEMLLAHVLHKKRIDLYVAFDRVVSEAELASLKGLIQRRSRKEPIQYILGTQEFWSLPFKVGPGVLIPRPETECLVEEALKILGPLHILDLGTGSGVIPIALAKEIPEAKFYAVDISDKALEYARENATTHHVLERIQFQKSDLFSSIPKDQKFDVILSNPPYISTGEWNGLETQIKEFEPKEALLAGEEGIEVHRRILKEAPQYLKSEGAVILEIAPHQASLLKEYVVREKVFKHFEIVKDYGHKDRILIVWVGGAEGEAPSPRPERM
ncbi:MAG: protein-(glutamine-N5) methyltransferase, release factor-specific [Deltaproteobacteria bacterium GWA2_38_16]|nr:MAG: protein-(glutamine-N5) methyltransferase, release factor-specific [Deltaproteobacteria bacterium GWA2_38_16]OGQ02288.1 MAG: protein-(glutamine-N5) methyltransferase, release factor-specific [Deltaproteobacteria bacterium RIFCSPHIGHO2_02_FULL_38_15]HBQ22055.1 peptide chain release factor N(5)-glutamine methyltransferase [Deltaproteobacteria bacterium]